MPTADQRGLGAAGRRPAALEDVQEFLTGRTGPWMDYRKMRRERLPTDVAEWFDKCAVPLDNWLS
jgi:hypothetical protein